MRYHHPHSGVTHDLVHEDGTITKFQLGPVAELLYAKLLEDPYRVVSSHELAGVGGFSTAQIGGYMNALRVALNRRGVTNVIFNRPAHGYSLRRRYV